MKLQNTLLMAVLGLTMGALTAQSANIQISSLPFNITAPGTYILTGNLISSATRTSTDTGAINISTAITGAVAVALKGFTITGPGSNSFGVTIGSISSGVSNTYPITVRNGTIANFEYGVSAITQTPLSDITVNNIVFDVISTGTAVGYGINFFSVNSSTIKNCSFNDATYGIADYGSAGGNRYDNITFVGNVYPLIVEGGPITLNHCQFDGPPGN
jgi:hypothetical protein